MLARNIYVLLRSSKTYKTWHATKPSFNSSTKEAVHPTSLPNWVRWWSGFVKSILNPTLDAAENTLKDETRIEPTGFRRTMNCQYMYYMNNSNDYTNQIFDGR